jgi:hypothetical protein
MPPFAHFNSYNVITVDQQDRLRCTRQPLTSLVQENPTLFNTWAVNEELNNSTNNRPITDRHGIEACDCETKLRTPKSTLMLVITTILDSGELYRALR